MHRKAKTHFAAARKENDEWFHSKAAKINVEVNNGDDGADAISDVASVVS